MCLYILFLFKKTMGVIIPVWHPTIYILSNYFSSYATKLVKVTRELLVLNAYKLISCEWKNDDEIKLYKHSSKYPQK